MPDPFPLTLQAVTTADSAQALIDAVEALAALKDERAIPTLIEVLGFNNPGAAVAAVEGLIQIGIPAVSSLLEKLDGYNYGARAWAIRALAGIGDPRGQDLLLEAVGDFALSVRRAAACGLGKIHWQWVPVEQRQERWLRSQTTLLQTLQDEEWVVRYAAIVGLQALMNAVTLPATLTPAPAAALAVMTDHLQTLAQTDDALAVRARAQWAIQATAVELSGMSGRTFV